MPRKFQTRQTAGQQLADHLMQYKDDDVLVLGLPRGGIPVAYEVARALDAPLDVFLVRKIGYPGHEEMAMGAIASGGVRVMNERIAAEVPEAQIEKVVEKEQAEMEHREELYRDHRPAIDIAGKTVILVDDGIATGATMAAAIEGLKQHNPAKIVVAVPAGAPSACRQFQNNVDDVVCVISPEPYRAVGAWYKQFGQTSNERVRDLLKKANQKEPA